MPGTPIKKSWDPWKMYDVNNVERKAMEERAKMRTELKLEWQKKFTNPFRTGEGGFVFDPAIQRYNSMKVTQWDHFKITPKTTWYGLALFVLPVAILTCLVFNQKRNVHCGHSAIVKGDNHLDGTLCSNCLDGVPCAICIHYTLKKRNLLRVAVDKVKK